MGIRPLYITFKDYVANTYKQVLSNKVLSHFSLSDYSYRKWYKIINTFWDICQPIKLKIWTLPINSQKQLIRQKIKWINIP